MQKNLAQEAVIDNVYGQIIVIACPGSGKTTTLLRRINHMVEDEGINPSEILMITFTKAAAKEMGDRYAEKFNGNPGITFCTIHALCFAILKKFKKYTYDNILIDQQDIIFELIKYNKDVNDINQFVNDILTDISVVKNNRVSLSDFEPTCCEDKELFINIYKNYEKVKKEQEKVDFDDILLETYELLENNRDILDWIRDRYGYIHVDEYQDTNFLQRDIIYKIAGPNGNLTVVGDDDQSIYAFRGAKPEVMLNFKKDYPDAKDIYMSTNYRSDQNIIKSAALLVEKNEHRYPKDIIAASQNTGKVSYLQFNNKKTQLMCVAKKIQQLIKKGVKPENIAVLYRTNSQSSTIADILMEYDIPFQCNETIESKYSHWLFRDILSYYKMSQRKISQADFVRTITHPNRYFQGINIKNINFNRNSFKKALHDPLKEEWKNKKTEKNIDNYFNLLDYISILSPEKMMDALYYNGGYENYLQDYAEFRNCSEIELLNIWNSYEEDIARNHISTFEDWEKYANRYNLLISEKQNNKSGVCLSTMHKSKGLEWDYVFIIDCVDGMCPFSKAKTVEEIEEERRLFYVAMTRAKNELYMYSYMQSRNKNIQESPFIKESGM